MSEQGTAPVVTAEGGTSLVQGSSIVLLTLAAGQFLMTLDSSVMNVSIATVAKDVGTTVTGSRARSLRTRLDGLRAALAILSILTICALFAAQRIPEVQPGGVKS